MGSKTKIEWNALDEARAARMAAQDAGDELEELLWEVQRHPRGWRRLAALAPADETEPSHPSR